MPTLRKTLTGITSSKTIKKSVAALTALSVLFFANVAYADVTVQPTARDSTNLTAAGNPGFTTHRTICQSFLATATGSVTTIKIPFYIETAAAGVTMLEMMANSAGLPDGTTLGSTTFNQNSLSTSALNPGQTYTISPAVSVTSGTTYWVCAHTNSGTFPAYTGSGTNFIDWPGCAPSCYADGETKRYDGAAWQTPGSDLNMSVVITTGGASPAANIYIRTGEIKVTNGTVFVR